MWVKVVSKYIRTKVGAITICKNNQNKAFVKKNRTKYLQEQPEQGICGNNQNKAFARTTRTKYLQIKPEKHIKETT